jgi:hypothetical protein
VPKHARLLLVATVVVTVAPPAWAYRPFTGTDAAGADPGEIELEIGPLGYLRTGGRDALVAPALIANWGLARDLELVLEGRQIIPLDPVPGEPRLQLLDTQLSVKWVMRDGCLQGGTGPSVASEWSMLLPETGSRRFGAALATIVSMRGPALTLHLNGAAALTRARDLGLFGGLIVEGPDAWAVRPVAEAFVDREGPVTELSGLAGALWRWRDTVVFDAAARLAWLRPADVRTTELRVGLTWSFSIG